MENIRVLMVLFCLLNVVIITNFPYLTNASSSCKKSKGHSPPINPHGTHAILTLNNFDRGGDGGGAAECDERFHPLPERVVALSTGWYNNGKRCGKMIKIKASNGRSTVAKVVDECDSGNGCNKKSCKNNVVDASETVWKDLRLNTDKGEVPVTWTIL